MSAGARLIVAAVVVSWGCGRDGGVGEPTEVSVRDSAGVTIVENPAPDRSRRLTAALLTEIGVLDGPEEYQLFQVSAVTRLSDGAVVVGNGGSREVRVYEADGSHRVTIGGPGQGPRELSYPNGVLALPGDTILVQDRLDRVWFTSHGTFVRRETRSFEALRALLASGRGSEGGSWVPGGTFLVPIYEWHEGPPSAGPPFRPPITIVRVTEDFTALDTLGRYGGIEQQYVDVGGSRVTPVVPPYGANATWSTGAADGSVAVGDNAAPEVHVFDVAGRLRIVRWQAEAEPITSDELSAWLDRQRSSSWARDQLPELERAWAGMDIPETKAYYGPVAIGTDGSLWVAASADGAVDPAQLMHFDSGGTYRGMVVVPGTFRVLAAGPGWVAGVHFDEDGVEFVRLYAVEGSQP